MTGSSWTCRCGEVEMVVRDVPEGGSHLVCYCNDCRAFARLHGAEAALDAAGGVDLYQTTPERVEIRRGAERLRVERLTRRGPLRWYVACCGAPLALTAPRRGVPFLSLMASGLQAKLPKPVARVHRGSALGAVPRPHGSAYALIGALARRTLRSRFSGGWKATPFFTETGETVSPVTQPDADAMRSARGRPN